MDEKRDEIAVKMCINITILVTVLLSLSAVVYPKTAIIQWFTQKFHYHCSIFLQCLLVIYNHHDYHLSKTELHFDIIFSYTMFLALRNTKHISQEQFVILYRKILQEQVGLMIKKIKKKKKKGENEPNAVTITFSIFEFAYVSNH